MGEGAEEAVSEVAHRLNGDHSRNNPCQVDSRTTWKRDRHQRKFHPSSHQLRRIWCTCLRTRAARVMVVMVVMLMRVVGNASRSS